MMNNDHPNMNRSGRADETAQDIFARIQQRRATAVNGARNERSAPRQESTCRFSIFRLPYSAFWSTILWESW